MACLNLPEVRTPTARPDITFVALSSSASDSILRACSKQASSSNSVNKLDIVDSSASTFSMSAGFEPMLC